MAFSIYARGPIEQGSQTPNDQFETYGYMDNGRYEILPSGVLIVDKDGDGNCWVLAPDRWQWVRSNRHAPGEDGKCGADELGADF